MPEVLRKPRDMTRRVGLGVGVDCVGRMRQVSVRRQRRAGKAVADIDFSRPARRGQVLRYCPATATRRYSIDPAINDVWPQRRAPALAVLG
jgi:hypothetical protein